MQLNCKVWGHFHWVKGGRCQEVSGQESWVRWWIRSGYVPKSNEIIGVLESAQTVLHESRPVNQIWILQGKVQCGSNRKSLRILLDFRVLSSWTKIRLLILLLEPFKLVLVLSLLLRAFIERRFLLSKLSCLKWS